VLSKTIKPRKIIAENGKSFALRDLAKLASVDVSTVSRALNNDPRVKPTRAAMIRELAEQIGYRPRPLRSKRARSVGLLVPPTPAGGYDQFLERIGWAAQRVLAQRKMHVNLEVVGENGSRQLPAIVEQNRVDGVLLAGASSPELARQIRELGMPAVGINGSMELLGISCVRSDPAPAIHQAILNLAARGHESFALLMKAMNFPTAHARHSAYLESLKELGIDANPEWIVTDLQEDLAGGREGVRQLQERGALPTAILCENDWLALGAMHELQRQQIRVPQDVSVVGHDDLWVCERLEPTLTSIQRAEGELVEKAVDLLVDHIEDRQKEPIEILLQGNMVWRQSTGPAPQRLLNRK
jgi:DNA-binding LacI/PurR family transcriptional regulator